jgi:hypothetical protein
LKEERLGPLRQGQRLDTTESKTRSSKEYKPPKHTRAPPAQMHTPPEHVPTLGTNRSDRFPKPVRPVPPNRSGRLSTSVMRARIKAPFDGEIISPKTTRQSNTIVNVKGKIDNIKAKIQDKEEKGSWSRPTLARRPVFGQLAASPASSPLEDPRDKYPPRMISLLLAREVSASHDKSGPSWHVGPGTQLERHHRRAWRSDSPRHVGTIAGDHASSSPQQEP